MSKLTWEVGDDGRHLYCDFADVRLDLDGNWGSSFQRLEFARELAAKLNTADDARVERSQWDGFNGLAGWQFVPVKPSKEMQDAYRGCLLAHTAECAAVGVPRAGNGRDYSVDEKMRIRWDAMLRAAPEAPRRDVESNERKQGGTRDIGGIKQAAESTAKQGGEPVSVDKRSIGRDEPQGHQGDSEAVLLTQQGRGMPTPPVDGPAETAGVTTQPPDPSGSAPVGACHMNLTVWTGIREYIAAEVRLALLRHRRDHCSLIHQPRAAEIADAEEQSTRMETSVREAL